MTCFIGENIAAQGLRDLNALLTHKRRMQSAWDVVLDGVGLARQIKDASPKTNVIVRAGFEDGYWVKQDASKLLEYWRKEVGDADLWCYADNEQGTDPDWHINLIKLNAASAKPLKLVILNISVGTPPPEEWRTPKVLELLRLASQYREWCVLGLHEYACGVITSGLVGGPPCDFPPHHGDFIQPKNWPEREKVQKLTKWHMGRFQFMVKACEDNGIQPPRCVLSEWGFDDVSDIKWWTDTLAKTLPYQSIRGYKSLLAQWKLWWPQWSEDEAHTNQLVYAAENIYAGTIVEGGCLYNYAHKNAEWEQFDIETRTELKSRLEQYAQTTVEVTPPTELPPMQKPANASPAKRFKALMDVEMLNGTGAGYNRICTIPAGAEADLHDEPQPFDGLTRSNYQYATVRTGEFTGKGGFVKVLPQAWQKVSTTGPVKPPEVVTQTGETPVVKEEPATRYKMYMFLKEVTLTPVVLKELTDQGFVFEQVGV